MELGQIQVYSGDKKLDQQILASVVIHDRVGMYADGVVIDVHHTQQVLEPKENTVFKIVLNGVEYGRYKLTRVEVHERGMTISATAFEKEDKIKDYRSQNYGKSLDMAIKKIAKRAGLEVFIDRDLGDLTSDSFYAQENESDLHFLYRTLKHHDAYYKIFGKHLIVLSENMPGFFGTERMGEIEIDTRDILSGWRLSREGREQYGSIKVPYLDDGFTQYVKAGKKKPLKTISQRFKSRSDAKKYAEKMLQSCEKMKTMFRFKIYGNSQMRAMRPFQIKGFHNSVNDIYLAEEVRHEFRESYITHVSAKKWDKK